MAERLPQADEAILIASEFAANSVLHSASRGGGAFTLHAEIRPDRLRIEVEDAGGPWHDEPRDDSRPHGFDVVAAIARPGKWGIDGDARGRIPSTTAVLRYILWVVVFHVCWTTKIWLCGWRG